MNAVTPPIPDKITARDANVYHITWSDNVTVEKVEAVYVSIDGDGDGCRITFWRGGIVLSALSREISEIRLVQAWEADEGPAEPAHAEQSGGNP